jgi:hypothetical protein
MEIELTKEQLDLVKNRLKENLKEEKALRVKQELGEEVSGWDFIELDDEQGKLESIIKTGKITI